MPGKPLPQELGRLIEVHQPLRPPRGLLLILAVSLTLPVLLAVTPPGPLVGLAAFAVLLPTLFLALAESFLLRHELYENGIVFRSVPGLPRYVIPHYTINPRTLELGSRRVHDGSLSETGNRRFRVCPIGRHPTIRFDGLDPKFARKLSNGKLDWHTAAYEPLGIKGSTQVVPRRTNRWVATYAHAERHLQTIQHHLELTQRQQPYYREKVDRPYDDV